MDKHSVSTPCKSRLVEAITKVVHIRAVTGVAPIDGVPKVKSHDNKSRVNAKSQRVIKSHENTIDDGIGEVNPQEKGDQCAERKAGVCGPSSDEINDKEYRDRLAFEAFVSQLFASISTIKAAYAQIQHAQSPYGADEIQSADKVVVSEFKSLSSLKHCYLKKKQLDPSAAKTTMISAEIKEQKSLLKTFETMGRKLESQLKLKDSEIIFLKEKIEEANQQNRLIEKRLNQSGQLFTLEKLSLSGLSPTHFIAVLRSTVKYIQNFAKLMIDEIRGAGWDFDAAVSSIEPDVVYWKEIHKCFAFDSFVSREMFGAFHHPNFSLPNESLPDKDKRTVLFFERFMELKSVKTMEYLVQKPRSTFAKFCRAKYLILVHPRMESSLFGNMSQRNLVNAGEFPDTSFFASFAEMAKRVWLLHCLAFSFEPEASIFQVRKGCRFSEVFMQSISDKEGDNAVVLDPKVALSVIPGFQVGKTVIQCQVYLSKARGASSS